MSTYKKFKKDDIVEDYHGTKVAAPFRWLEDDESKDTTEFIAYQDQLCSEYFEDIPVIDEYKSRLKDFLNYDDYYVPKKVEELLFYEKKEGLQNQPVLYLERENGDQREVFIDPNELSDDGTVAMNQYFPSKHGKYVAYSISAHGSDWQTIKIRDVESKEDLEDELNWCRFTNAAWIDDESFYYTRFPKEGEVPEEERSNYAKIYKHKLNTPQSEDVLIYEEPEDKEISFFPGITDDDKYLIIHAQRGTSSKNMIYYKDLENDGPIVKLLNKEDSKYRFIGNQGSLFYFHTDLDAPRGRIIAIDINSPEVENYKELVAEQKDIIHQVGWVNSQFVVVYMQDAQHQIEIYNPDGGLDHSVKMPFIGSLTMFTGHEKDQEMFFGLASYLRPTTIYKYNLEEQKMELIFETELPFNPDEYTTEQVFYTSKDGTRVSLFLTHKKDIELNGENPVILYGYGGFTISLTPFFQAEYLPWLEKGGVLAVANLRGGSEYGEEWHKAGMLENKQNVFDDFISAGEWLIENDYTQSSKLSIMGGSNGGLLVSASMVQRPDLFGAVICRVPVIDMLRYHKFTIGRYWVPEYGNAEENPEDFKFLYAYSPLHNIDEDVDYPPLLIATADTDNRVVPAHALKFTAALQDVARDVHPIILRLERKAGHGHGKPTSKIIGEWADFYGFLSKELNLY